MTTFSMTCSAILACWGCRFRFDERPVADGGGGTMADARIDGPSGPSLFGQTVLAMNGLVAYWPFDGNLLDSGPNAQHAIARTIVAGGVSECVDVEGRGGVQIGSASNQNSFLQQSFVEVPAPIGSVFDAATLTVVTWARADLYNDPGAAEGWNSLVDRNSLWYSSLFSTQDGPPIDGEFVVRVYSDNMPDSGGSNRVGIEPRPLPPVLIAPGTWHMYAMTYDGASLNAYYDGALLMQEAYTGALGPTIATPTTAPWGNYNLTWGAWEQRADWFTGCFDDTAYFDRALTAPEIAMLFATKP